jgi:hypothetical protein
MAQTFAINGTEIERVTSPDWVDDAGDRQSLDGNTPLTRWRRVVARADVLTMAEWDTLRALEGQKVSITIPPYQNRNAADWKTYYAADFDRLDGRQDGPAFTGVTAEFLVRL